MGGLDKPNVSKILSAAALGAALIAAQPSQDPHKPPEKQAGFNRLKRELDRPKIEEKDGRVIVTLNDPPPEKKDPENSADKNEA